MLSKEERHSTDYNDAVLFEPGMRTLICVAVVEFNILVVSFLAVFRLTLMLLVTTLANTK